MSRRVGRRAPRLRGAAAADDASTFLHRFATPRAATARLESPNIDSVNQTSTPTARTGGWRTVREHGREASGTVGHPRVTVLTVVRNGAGTLEACIRSVMAQTWPDIEHVIVDGGSTDGTIALLERFDRHIAFWVSEPDAGIYDALNKGLRLATGEAYVVLGCDDLLLPTGVEMLMREGTGAMVVSGMVLFHSPHQGGKLIRNHSAGTLIRREAHDGLGLYDPSYRIAADTKFLMKARLAGLTRDIDDVVGVFTAGGASANYGANVREHARAMQESGAWSAWHSLLWRAPRLALAALRSGQ